MINGDSNQINGDAALEFVINGENNTVKYSRFVNGKRPTVKENAPGNMIEKTSRSITKNELYKRQWKWQRSRSQT